MQVLVKMKDRAKKGKITERRKKAGGCDGGGNRIVLVFHSASGERV